jgi:uncharacterized protein with ATP-grasp and redox domains
MTTTPPEMGMIIYKAIYQTADIADPFKEIKQQCTTQLMSRYDEFKKQIVTSEDPLYTALKFSCFGNAIDFGANPNFDIAKDLENLIDKDFDVCEYDKFTSVLKTASNILFIADNAGETVFDRLLIEQLGKPVEYAVRSKPIINDATIEDALDSGIDEVAHIMSMIISKGQGNYETLSDQKRSIFFLLKIKCPVIARDIDIACGSIVLVESKYGN